MAGIIQDGDELMENVCINGKDFRDKVGGVKKIRDKDGEYKWEIVNKSNFKALIKSMKVLARSTPDDKFALIAGLKEFGYCVAVTADGINDVEALKHANVGICMGISGCEAAKEASDMIILDDNLCSVLNSVKWGRNLMSNIRKFIQFQLTVCFTVLLIVFISGLTLGECPFNVI